MSVASSVGSPFNKGNATLYPPGAVGSSSVNVSPINVTISSGTPHTVFSVTPPAGLYMFVFNPIVEGFSAPYEILSLYVDVDANPLPYRYRNNTNNVILQPSFTGGVYVDGTQEIQFMCAAVSTDGTNIVIKTGSVIGLYCIG